MPKPRSTSFINSRRLRERTPARDPSFPQTFLELSVDTPDFSPEVLETLCADTECIQKLQLNNI